MEQNQTVVEERRRVSISDNEYNDLPRNEELKSPHRPKFQTLLRDGLDKRSQAKEDGQNNEDNADQAEPTVPYEGVTFFFLTTENPFRSRLHQLVQTTVYEWTTSFFIFLSVLSLILNSPTDTTKLISVLNIIDNICQSVFTAELVINWIVYGPILHFKFSAWNRLDAIVTIGSWIAMYASSHFSVSAIRAVKAIRPLRAARRLGGVKAILDSLVVSLPLLVDLLRFVLFFFFCFGIMGMAFYRGSLSRRCVVPETGEVSQPVSYCKIGGSIYQGQYQCPVNQMCEIVGNPEYGFAGFDNVGLAFLTIWKIVSLDQWSEILYALMESEVSFLSVAFFVGLIIIVTFICLNLFVAVINTVFGKIRKTSGSKSGFVSSPTKRLSSEVSPSKFNTAITSLAGGFKARSQNMTIMQRLHAMEPPAWWGPLQLRFAALIKDRKFEYFMTACILTNFGFIATEHDGQSDSWGNTIHSSDMFFTSVYALECIIKLIGYGGFRAYFTDPDSGKTNRFDFVVSLVTVFTTFTSADVKISFVRSLRVLRLFRLFRKMSGLVRILESALNGVAPILNLLTLVIFSLLIFSIVGVQLYGGKMPNLDDDYLDTRQSFETFPNAMLSLFTAMTGDHWTVTMQSALLTSSAWTAPIFFVGFFVFSNYVLLNLFTALILENFEIREEEKLRKQKHMYEHAKRHGGALPGTASTFGSSNFGRIMDTVSGMKNKVDGVLGAIAARRTSGSGEPNSAEASRTNSAANSGDSDSSDSDSYTDSSSESESEQSDRGTEGKPAKSWKSQMQKLSSIFKKNDASNSSENNGGGTEPSSPDQTDGGGQQTEASATQQQQEQPLDARQWQQSAEQYHAYQMYARSRSVSPNSQQAQQQQQRMDPRLMAYYQRYYAMQRQRYWAARGYRYPPSYPYPNPSPHGQGQQQQQGYPANYSQWSQPSLEGQQHAIQDPASQQHYSHELQPNSQFQPSPSHQEYYTQEQLQAIAAYRQQQAYYHQQRQYAHQWALYYQYQQQLQQQQQYSAEGEVPQQAELSSIHVDEGSPGGSASPLLSNPTHPSSSAAAAGTCTSEDATGLGLPTLKSELVIASQKSSQPDSGLDLLPTPTTPAGKKFALLTIIQKHGEAVMKQHGDDAQGEQGPDDDFGEFIESLHSLRNKDKKAKRMDRCRYGLCPEGLDVVPWPLDSGETLEDVREPDGRRKLHAAWLGADVLGMDFLEREFPYPFRVDTEVGMTVAIHRVAVCIANDVFEKYPVTDPWWEQPLADANEWWDGTKQELKAWALAQLVKLIQPSVAEGGRKGSSNDLTGGRRGSASKLDVKDDTSVVFLMGVDHWFRSRVLAVARSKWTERLFMVAVFASSVMLAFERPREAADPTDSNLSSFRILLQKAEIFFMIMFTMECLLKVFAYGVYRYSKSYLKDPWNKIDFVILLTIYLSYLIPSVRFVRVLRAIRPIRIVKSIQKLQVIVMALWKSVPAILNVTLVTLFSFIIFGVLGVNLFKGLFYACTDGDIQTKADCIGTFLNSDDILTPRVWKNAPFTFDNLGSAILTLMIVASRSNWSDIMYHAMDAVNKDQQPVVNNAPANALFFVAFIIVGSFFIMNLFVGVIIENINQARGISFLTDEQKQWSDTQRALLQLRPTPEIRRPTSRIRGWLYDLILNKWFERGIYACIVLNICAMAAEYSGQSAEYSLAMESLEKVFLSVFIIEAAFKMAAFGATRYFSDAWRKFDFALVVGSLMSLVLETASDNKGVVLLSRVFRILRIFRIVNQVSGLQFLFDALIVSLPSILNISLLMFLLLYIYTVVGMQLFGHVRFGDAINRRVNFRSFANGLLLLFRVTTLDSWDALMLEYGVQQPYCTETATFADCGSRWAWLYFVTFFTLGSYVFLNLVIAIILDNFGHCYNKENFKLKPEHFKMYQVLWKTYDPLGSGFIGVWQVKYLLQDLWDNKNPMGINMYSDDQRLVYPAIYLEIETVMQKKKRRIAFHKLLLILSRHCVNPTSLTYAEEQERKKLVAVAAEYILVNKLTAVMKGFIVRKVFVKKMDPRKIELLHKVRATLRRLNEEGKMDSIIAWAYEEKVKMEEAREKMRLAMRKQKSRIYSAYRVAN